MPFRESPAHEKALADKIKEMEEQGWRVINLERKSPDAIAVKDGKIIAIEILKKIRTERKNPEAIRDHGRYVSKYSGGFTLAGKRNIYKMFDDIEFGFWSDMV